MSDGLVSLRARAERVEDWAQLNGDDLCRSLGLDSVDDAQAIAAVEDALWVAHDALALLDRLEAAERASRIWEATGRNFETAANVATERAEAAEARLLAAQQALREIVDYPINEKQSAGVHFAVVRSIAREALAAVGRDPQPQETAAILDAASEVARIYEGLRLDANDGEFALWSEDDLVAALHALMLAVGRVPAQEDKP